MYNLLCRFREFIENEDYAEAKDIIAEWMNDQNCTLNDLSTLMGPVSEQVLSSNEYYNPAKTQLALAALESLAQRSIYSFDEVLEDVLWNIIDYSDGFEIEYTENMNPSFALKDWIIELLNNKSLCPNNYQRLELIRFLHLFVILDSYDQATWERIIRGITSTLCHLDIAYITGTIHNHRVHLKVRGIKKLFIHLSLKCQLTGMANKITSQIISRFHESELECILHIIRISQNLSELGLAKYRINRNRSELNKNIYLSMKTLGIVYDDSVYELSMACCHPYLATYTTSAISTITNAILTLTCVHAGESKTDISEKQPIFKKKMEERDMLIKHLPAPKVAPIPILLFQREYFGQISRLKRVACSLPNCTMLQDLGTLKAPPN